jgi:hypothetical protein
MTFDYRSKEAQRVANAEPIRRQTLWEWVEDLCKCKECRDGFVSFEVNGYETLFACPACDRYRRDLYPYQAIPTAKKWMGSYTVYTETEMFARKQNRQEVADGLRKGAAKVQNFDTSDIGKPF